MAIRRPLRSRPGSTLRSRRPGTGSSLRRPVRASEGMQVEADSLTDAAPDGAVPAAPAPVAGSVPPQASPHRRRVVRPVVRRGSDGAGLNPVVVRIGLLAIILVVGGIIKLATAKPAGDENYFREAAELSRRVERQIIMSPGNVKRQVDALPISGVTDPKLREFHGCLVEIFSLHEKNLSDEELERRFVAAATRLDQLTDELNRTYAR